MHMRLSDIQPQYFPRLHYFARMLAADVFVLRDEVQFVRKHKYPDGVTGVSYQAHTPVKAPAGAQLLGVPVTADGRKPIWQVRVCHDQPWARKHVRTIESLYASAPNLRRILPEIDWLLQCRFATIADLDIATTCWALGHVLGQPLRIPDHLSLDRVNQMLAAQRWFRLRRIVRASEHAAPGPDPSSASERTLALCRRLGADEYVGGNTAVRAYLDTALLQRHGIEVRVQSWQCPAYPQRHGDGDGFVPDLSIIDLLMNAPAEAWASLLRTPEPASGARPGGDAGTR